MRLKARASKNTSRNRQTSRDNIPRCFNCSPVMLQTSFAWHHNTKCLILSKLPRLRCTPQKVSSPPSVDERSPATLETTDQMKSDGFFKQKGYKNIFEKRCVMYNGNVCTWKSPAITSHDFICIPVCNLFGAWTTLFQTSIIRSVPKIFYFSLKICLAYVSTRASVLAAERSASNSQPSERQRRRYSKHTFAVRNVPESRLTTSLPNLKVLFTTSCIHPSLSYSKLTHFPPTNLPNHIDEYLLAYAGPRNVIHVVCLPLMTCGEFTVLSVIRDS